MPGEGLLDGLAMAVELVADGRADEVGAVGVESLPHQQVDMAEVDIAEIDGDLLAIAGFGPQLLNIFGQVRPSLYHPDGWYLGLAPRISSLLADGHLAPSLFLQGICRQFGSGRKDERDGSRGEPGHDG